MLKEINLYFILTVAFTVRVTVLALTPVQIIVDCFVTVAAAELDTPSCLDSISIPMDSLFED